MSAPTSAPKLEQMFTSAEVAKALRMHVQTVRRKSLKGELNSVMVGRERRYTRADIDAYLRGETPTSKQAAKSAPKQSAKPSRSPRYTK